MAAAAGAIDRRIFYADRRATWRVTWTLAGAFLGVAWLMQREGAGAWPVFAAIALGLLGICAELAARLLAWGARVIP